MLEPKDGDFVAYIEALQIESAARLAKQSINVNIPAAQGATSKPAGIIFNTPGTTSTSAGDASRAIGSLGTASLDAAAIKAGAIGLIGLIAFLNWLVQGGAVAFLIAVVLLAYAVPRLLTVFRAASQPPANRAAINQVFGRSGTKP